MLARLVPLSAPPGHSRVGSNGSPPIRARPPCRPAGVSHSNRDQRAQMHGSPGLSEPGFPCQARTMISSEHCRPVQVCEKMNHLHRQRESRDGRWHGRQDYPCTRACMPCRCRGLVRGTHWQRIVRAHSRHPAMALGLTPALCCLVFTFGSGGHSGGVQSNHRGTNLAARPSNSAQKRGACAVACERCWMPGGESWHC
jgi:hypothetical protein